MPQILVIDDDPTAQFVLQRTLQKQGYEVAVVSNGESGIALAQKLRPALIICDWMLPQIDGLEVCRRIKSDPNLATTFFILLTARSTVEDRVEGLDNGADEFLTKPIDLSELKARVRAGLRLHQLTRDFQMQKHQLEKELTEAADYVRSLLPLPMTGKVAIDARFIPSRQLGGDCFDYYWLDPDYLAIYLLDVSGHGLGAALPSVSVMNLLRSQSLPNVNFYHPSEVLKALNETFQMSEQHDRYFTIWYGVYNQAKRQLFYASAGHPPAILVTANSDQTVDIKLLKTPNLPIGMLSDTRFGYERCDIADPSTLYIFSDGAYEILLPDQTTWGLDAFIELLEVYCQSDRCHLDLILQHIRQLNTQETFSDDLSLLQINFS